MTLRSNGSRRFLETSVVALDVPGGVTQRFRIRGSAPATPVISFQQSHTGAHIVDPVAVH